MSFFSLIGDTIQEYVIDPITDDRDDTVVSERKNEEQVEEYNQSVNNRTYNLDPKTLLYPLELHTDLQPHAVVFHINVRSNSRLGTQIFNEQKDQPGWAARQQAYQDEYMSKENRAKGENADTIMGVAGSVAAAVPAYAASGNLVGENPSKLARPLLTAGGTALVGAAAAVLTETSTTYRLDTSIHLPIQTAPSTQYTAQWADESLGPIVGALASGKSGLTDIISTEAGSLIGRGIIAGAANVPKALGVDANFGDAIEATTKKVGNPYKEQLFKTVGFRKFSFQYQFIAKNEQEYNNIRDIIFNFKRHMHPERSDGGLFLIYPSEFNIEYHYRGSNNSHIAKISSCVLTDMKVTYGGQDGVFNTVQGMDGAPSEINVLLSFTELEQLNASRIEDGL